MLISGSVLPKMLESSHHRLGYASRLNKIISGSIEVHTVLYGICRTVEASVLVPNVPHHFSQTLNFKQKNMIAYVVLYLIRQF